MPENRPATRLGADERREQLLGAALTTFGRKGFVATSMNDVALEAGVTKPVLYQHFESKHHLYLELMRLTASRLTQALGAVAAATDDPRELLERSFGVFFAFLAEEPGHFTVLFGEGVRSDSSFMAELLEVEDAVALTTAELIDVAGLSQEDRLLLARSLVGMLEAAGRSWTQDRERRDPEAVAARVAELAWRGLRGLE